MDFDGADGLGIGSFQFLAFEKSDLIIDCDGKALPGLVCLAIRKSLEWIPVILRFASKSQTLRPQTDDKANGTEGFVFLRVAGTIISGLAIGVIVVAQDSQLGRV
ncbi:hypothetical protein D3C87_1304040 [compost metagenome]